MSLLDDMPTTEFFDEDLGAVLAVIEGQSGLVYLNAPGCQVLDLAVDNGWTMLIQASVHSAIRHGSRAVLGDRAFTINDVRPISDGEISVARVSLL
jgi:hypothetical protein